MSRLRTGHTAEAWADLGPSGCNRKPSAYVGGSLVVAGPVNVVMGLWGQGSHKKDKAAITEARLRFNPDNSPRAA